MADEKALRTRAREAMKTGNLPNHRPEHVWGGSGTGESCAVCGDAVAREDVELELQFASSQDAGATTYHVHAGCFAVWELERRSGSLKDNSLPLAKGEGMMSDRECHTTSQGQRD